MDADHKFLPRAKGKMIEYYEYFGTAQMRDAMTA
jgi:hypothetical protein